MGCNVTTVADELENRIERYSPETDLLLFYLPGDLYDDASKKAKFLKLCTLVTIKKKKMILIGEAKYHDELLKEHTELREYAWT